MHCDVTSMIFAYYSKRNSSRKKQNNELNLLKKVPSYFSHPCTETIQRWGEISLHRLFKIFQCFDIRCSDLHS